MSLQADTWLKDSTDKKRHVSTLLPPLPPPRSRGEDGEPWGHAGLPQHSLAATRGIRQWQGSVPLPEDRRAVRVPPLSGVSGRPERLFPLKLVTCRATAGEDLAGRHFCSAAGLITRGLASLPPAHGSPSPLHSLLNRSPAGKPRQSPVPPSPTSLSLGDASFPPPHLSLLFLANSPPPPGSSRSHNSILFMETNCPAGGCT